MLVVLILQAIAFTSLNNLIACDSFSTEVSFIASGLACRNLDEGRSGGFLAVFKTHNNFHK